MVLGGLAEQQIRARRHLTPAAAASTEHPCRSAPVSHVRGRTPLPSLSNLKRRLAPASRSPPNPFRTRPRASSPPRNASNTDSTTKTSFSPMHSRLLSNEPPVIIDRSRIQIGRLIHHHRRIARPGRDHALARFGRGPHHRRSAGHAQQRHAGMLNISSADSNARFAPWW